MLDIEWEEAEVLNEHWKYLCAFRSVKAVEIVFENGDLWRKKKSEWAKKKKLLYIVKYNTYTESLSRNPMVWAIYAE